MSHKHREINTVTTVCGGHLRTHVHVIHKESAFQVKFYVCLDGSIGCVNE